MRDKFSQLQDVALNLDNRYSSLLRSGIGDHSPGWNYSNEDKKQQADPQRFK
jgi:hypothetical protein